MPFNKNLCDDSVSIEFSTYIVVRYWMPVIEENQLSDCNLTICINTDNISITQEQVPYGEPIEVQDPCDETKTISVDNLMLNVAKLDGYIGYYVGAELLINSENTSIDSPEPHNPTAFSNFVTGDGITLLNDVDFVVLDPDDDTPLNLHVEAQDINISATGVNEVGDHIYFVRGVFEITSKDDESEEDPGEDPGEVTP